MVGILHLIVFDKGDSIGELFEDLKPLAERKLLRVLTKEAHFVRLLRPICYCRIENDAKEAAEDQLTIFTLVFFLLCEIIAHLPHVVGEEWSVDRCRYQPYFVENVQDEVARVHCDDNSEDS